MTLITTVSQRAAGFGFSATGSEGTPYRRGSGGPILYDDTDIILGVNSFGING